MIDEKHLLEWAAKVGEYRVQDILIRYRKYEAELNEAKVTAQLEREAAE